MTNSTEQKPAMEIAAPDISAYKQGNTGIDYVTTFDSGRPGPHIMINALTHGNEICGALALQFLMENEVRPQRGKLTLSFANVKAFSRFSLRQPYNSRYVDEDFNRVWSDDKLDGARHSHELERARELRPLVREADHLLDIHSMSQAAPPLLLTGMREKSVTLAKAMAFPAYVVMDKGHQAGRRMRDYGEFDDPTSAKTAMLVECGQHWARSSEQVARAATLRFLGQFDVVDPDFIARHLPAGQPEPQMVIEVTEAVTISGGDFRFVEAYQGYESIKDAGTVIGYDGDREVKTPYDECILIMPIDTARAKAGQTAVRLGRAVP